MSVGVGLDDLAGVAREEFLYAVEVARAQHDPGSEWDDFRDVLWCYLARVFGVEVSGVEVAGSDRGTGRPPVEPTAVPAVDPDV